MATLSKHSPDSKLAIVIPVDLPRRPGDLISKLERFVRAPGMAGMEIVIAHNDRGTKQDLALRRTLGVLPHVRLFSARFYTGSVNSGFLRNRAVEFAEAPIILLLDADIVSNPELFSECSNRVSSGEAPFIMLPCLYLTKWASKRLITDKISADEILDAYFSFRRRHFQHMASPSSILFLRKDEYWEIGGFDEAFVGHGYEDFDFALRLALHHGMIPICEDLLENRSYRAPLLAEGFRKYLGHISLPYILEKKIAFHLFHKKPVGDSYYQARAANAERFGRKVRDIMSRSSYDATAPSSLIDAFFSLCREVGVEARDYFVLFDTRPGYIDRLSTWTERFRFLIGQH
ncbi:glycosyltransferase family 2 protein [Cupriavidus alkaliphilus]|uniref:glycosyltransferase family 2 protein n=1 Tax=Cupriavidus alkaliphilus TaxID=942866 RepID=UPI0016075377|nr:glycosyltransferase family 2 protein [Cupriavidus alkaliphilus]MBB2917258.1 putative glycosyltransferase involved in capsule biosynthesis [Cupriavidus alkaliphilus]